MERSPTTPEDEEEEEVKVSAESAKKAIFYIYHPSRFLQQLLRSLFKCLGFHEISVTNNNNYSQSLNNDLSGAEDYSAYNNHSAANDQYDVAPSSSSQEAPDPPSTTTTVQQIGTSAIARRPTSQRPGPTTGPGPQHN